MSTLGSMQDLTPGITVTGTGEATAPPDLMIVDLGVSVLDESVSDAISGAARLAEALIEALEEGGVARPDIGTSSYSVGSEYDWSGSERRLLGYRATNGLRAKVRDMARAGEVIDASTRAAGDAAQVTDVGLSVEDPTSLYAEARGKAWADALAKAKQLADLAGKTLGDAVAISESFLPGAPPPVQRLRVEMAVADVSTPIEAGTTTVTATVHIRFELG